MTRACCPSCRLRFTPAAAAIFASCPECRRDIRAVASAEALVGYRLFDPTDALAALPTAADVALPIDVDPPEPT
jgi:hypothetical protein